MASPESRPTPPPRPAPRPSPPRPALRPTAADRPTPPSRPNPPPRAAATPSRPRPSPTHFGEFVSRTDLGQRMTDNEDAFLESPKMNLFAITDGSGAAWPAQMALDKLADESSHLRAFEARVARDGDTSSRLAVGHFFESVLNKAGHAVRDEMHKRAEGKVTAAAVALTLMGPFAYVAHIGDCRAYLFRDQKLRCLTSDHTLAMLQLKRGEITPDEFTTSPFKKTLTQGIGITPELRPDIAEVRVAPGDVFLLCSDGLHRMVNDRRIAELLAADGPLTDKARWLVEEANESGGKDNITVQLVVIEGDAVEQSGEDGTDQERVDVARVLGKCFLFQKISDAERLLLAPYFEYHAFEASDVVCREGDDGDSLFVVVSGKLRVTFQRAHLIDIQPGGWAGEIALAREGKRTATLTARERTVLLVLSRQRFQEILRRRPVLGAQLALPLLDFVGQRVADLGKRIRTISQVMAGELEETDA